VAADQSIHLTGMLPDDHYSETGRSEMSQSLPLNCAMKSVFIGV
jgi:hypothetical protein